MTARWLAGVLMLVSACAQADRIEGSVTHVSDGDTIWVRSDPGEAPRPVRLAGIDAPETCQSFGAQSREALTRRLLHRHVRVETTTIDIYQRAIGQVHQGDTDMAAWMVSRGYAWSSQFRGRAGPYDRQQARARQARLGLWQEDHPIPPREFRQTHGSCMTTH